MTSMLVGALLAVLPALQAPSDSVPLYTNLGTHHHAITTGVPLAQQYFDQGLRLAYGFNHEEAINSFRTAARLDPDCAMCYWGIAFALGPNINLPMDSSANAPALAAVREARARLAHASEPERAYIAAIAQRYSEDPGRSRASLDTAYANAMRELRRRYPRDDDAATLFADAAMNLAPWNYWTADGQPRPGTADLLATLELVLRRDPDHPGACHYYIHAVEASFQPERAVPCAERLPSLMPGAGHLVHMPAHVYMRVGRYGDAVHANEHAAHADEAFFERRPAVGFYQFYYVHNLHFLWAAAQMSGQSEAAVRAAGQVAQTATPDVIRQAPPFEFVFPTPLLALVRFGKWEDILREPAPPADLRYSRGIWHYARGRAFTANGRLEEAAREADSLAAILAATPADQVLGFNTAANLLGVAVHTLAGEMAAKRGDADNAVRELEEAVRSEDGLAYDEPPPWYYPVRQSLGAVLLTAGRAPEAETVYREDLKRNPENGWSLFGLARALHAQGKHTAAAQVDARFKKAWQGADVTLVASRF